MNLTFHKTGNTFLSLNENL